MDDWDLRLRTGELVYTWFYDAQAAGKHVYLFASHSHYYSPNIYDTPYWKGVPNEVVPGLIIGSAGARRYQLPKTAKKRLAPIFMALCKDRSNRMEALIFSA